MATSSGFALGFLRRLLCARTTGGDAEKHAHHDTTGHLLSAPEGPEPEGRSPCVVARLMGLDAMPAAAEARPQTLRRSRSAGSAEGGQRRSPCGLGDTVAVPRSPAPVRAPPSLREKPTYLRAENDQFLLLSFSPEEESDDAKKKAGDVEEAERRREDGPGKQRRPHRRRKLRFGDEDEGEESGRRERCTQQGSSPVSVLEARDVHEESSTTTTSSSLEDAEPSATSEVVTHFALEQQSSTRKQHTGIVQLEDMPHATSTVHALGCSDTERRHRRMVSMAEVSAADLTGIWQPVCRLVEEDLKNMEWLTRGGDGADVFCEMGSEILDQLIRETTVELVQLSSDALYALPPPSWTPKCSDKMSNWKYSCPTNVQAGYRLELGVTDHDSLNCQRKSPSDGALHSEIGSQLI